MKEKEPRPVIVRTINAGVHFGYLEYLKGMEAKLVRSKRIWRWKGPMTCSALAMSGLNIKESRVEFTGTVILTQAIEVIDCTDAAVMLLESAGWPK
jgi:hypothetical protein